MFSDKNNQTQHEFLCYCSNEQDSNCISCPLNSTIDSSRVLSIYVPLQQIKNMMQTTLITRRDKATIDKEDEILREVPGNDKWSDCGASEPDWASLNLGILICIECSGIHQNLGVHISKVRSITLDVRVWEPTILDLFRTLGNYYCNSMWEKLLQLPSDGLTNVDAIQSASKPSLKDAFHEKEKYILAKWRSNAETMCLPTYCERTI
ncbi:hypothetical protein KY290_031066 [Solanum tuberosum]|uniref:Arf-GAP domain-containing protein n=1 Tax=Solanum tuberosum TaxID=4113 RepID=A0ABQ7U9X6_SOLTU|nr:hypothetical protein KY290_031066 [Solanum tuberosum]